jgi:dimethylglycine dehydrogenase
MTTLVQGEIAATDCDIDGGEAVMQGDRSVSVCTSGGFGHTMGKSLAFAVAAQRLTRTWTWSSLVDAAR